MVKKILTDKLYLSVVGIVLVFILAVAYIFSAVLSEPLTSRPKTVSVDLAQTGGLFEGSQVTYRGVRIGKVTKIVPSDTGVVATVSLTSTDKIPTASHAVVRSLSPVGEQYLDFQPPAKMVGGQDKSTSGPYLESGDTVLATSTDIPTSLTQTVISISKVLNQIDPQKLKRVLGELSTGLAGTGDDIGQILDQGQQLLTTLDQVWPQTDRLITNAGPALSTITDNAGQLAQLGTTAKVLARFLKNYSPEFIHTLKTAPAQFSELVKLINDADKVLPGFLTTGVSFTDFTSANDGALRALLRDYAPGIQSLLNKVWNHHLNIQIIADKDSRCSYGTTRHDPRGPREAFQTGGHCPASLSYLQRGAAHAP
ncbi:MCE family protein [Nocardioides montaniterrae]